MLTLLTKVRECPPEFSGGPPRGIHAAYHRQGIIARTNARQAPSGPYALSLRIRAGRARLETWGSRRRHAGGALADPPDLLPARPPATPADGPAGFTARACVWMVRRA